MCRMCEEKVIGVHYDNHMSRWVGKMTQNGITIRGVFMNKEDAIKFRRGLEKAMTQRVCYNRDTKEFGTKEIEVKRPQNYCREDSVFSMSIERGYKKFAKTNLSDKSIEFDGFRFPEENYTIIYSKNATIVILEDGTKGIAKCEPNDVFSRSIGEEFAYGRAKAKSLKKKYGHVK